MNDTHENIKLRSTKRSLPIALLRARETLMVPVREMLSKSQISEQKWRVLRVVNEAGPLEQTNIAKQACLLLPSLTRILRSMEEDGYISRVPGQTDKRKSVVHITPLGIELKASKNKTEKHLNKRQPSPLPEACAASNDTHKTCASS